MLAGWIGYSLIIALLCDFDVTVFRALDGAEGLHQTPILIFFLRMTGDVMACIISKDSHLKWPKTHLAYEIDDSAFYRMLTNNLDRYRDQVRDHEEKTDDQIVKIFYDYIVRTIESSVDFFTTRTPFTFRLLDDTIAVMDEYPDADLIFSPHEGRCGTRIGYQGKPYHQISCDMLLIDTQFIIHEIGHALGLYHEQSRTDRQEYIDVHWHHIDPKLRHNFTIEKETDTAGTPYEYDSNMHYAREGGAIGPMEPGWTAFVPIVLDQIPVYLCYQKETGRFQFHTIILDGQVNDAGTQKTSIGSLVVGDEVWKPGIECFAPFQINGKAFLASFCSKDGMLQWHEIRSSKNKVQIERILRSETDLTKTKIRMVPITFNGSPYLLVKQLDNGQIAIYNPSEGGLGFEYLSGTQDDWRLKGDDVHLIPISLGSRSIYIEYANSTGNYRYFELTDPNQRPQRLSHGTWSKGWDTFTSFEFDGHPYFATLSSNSGRYHVCRVEDDGEGQKTTYSGQWTSGWTSLMSYNPMIAPLKRGLSEEVRFLSVKEASGEFAYCHIVNPGQGELVYAMPGKLGITTKDYTGSVAGEKELSDETIGAINRLYGRRNV